MRFSRRPRPIFTLLLLYAGCGSEPDAKAPKDAGGARDVSVLDAAPEDAAPGTDAGRRDAGTQGDATAGDTGRDALPGDAPGSDSGASDGGDAGPGGTGLQILSISDWHGQLTPLSSSAGQVGGAAVLSSYFQRERSQNPNTITLTAGDAFGGSPPLASFFNEEPAIRAMNLMGFDADTFGNHNFDRGTIHLQSMIDLASFPYVSSNLENLPQNLTGVTSPYHVLEIGGVRVALIGITNADAPSLVFPGRMGTITIQDPIAGATSARAAAMGAGATVFVAMTHLGVTTGTTAATYRGPLIDFASGVSGFDVILGDHTNIEVNTTINGALVVENLSKGQTYARIQLSIDPSMGSVTGGTAEILRPLVTGVTPDPAIEAELAPYQMMLATQLEGSMGVAAALFPRGGNIERLGEVALGNLIADAIRARYGSQLALTNGGGIRAPLPSTYAPANTALRRTSPGYAAGPPYDLVLADAYEVLPFGNFVVTRTVTGSQLWSMLEHSVGALPASSGRFGQISGFMFTYTSSAAVGSRVVSVTLDGGAPIPRDSTTYTLSTMDFLNSGGDGYTMLADGQGATRELAALILAEHVAALGTITPAVEGRIAEVAPPSCGATPRAPLPGEMLINEIHADPASTIDGDANGDGVRDAATDEFVELVNVSSSTLDLSGVTLSDAATIGRHEFGAVTLACGQAIVVFGGGDPTHPAWRPNWVPASSGSLVLTNSGDEVRIGSSAATPSDLAAEVYGAEGGTDESLVRTVERTAGSPFILHTQHPAALGRRFSPGTRVDGTAF